MSAPRGRSRSGDRFYNPPAVRRQLQLQQQQQLQEQQEQPPPPPQQQFLAQKQSVEKGKDKQKSKQQSFYRPVPVQRTKSPAESDDCASPTTATTPRAAIAPLSVPDEGGNLPNLSNLDRFLDHTTPTVLGQRFSKTSTRGWRTREDEFQPYFVLGDLWESFHEWSAYGAGVPLLLDGSDFVVQYYVPYLSGIQLYTSPSMPAPRSSLQFDRRPGEESDADSSRGSSDDSIDSEREKGANGFLHQVQKQQGPVEASTQGTNAGIKGLSISNKASNGSSSDETDPGSSPGVLAFEYFEHDPPYSREPLTSKISLLTSRFPKLKTYRSCDLSPTSWISVAWYPIYRIPTGPTLKNLDSCFLTYHSLSTPVCGAHNESTCPYGSRPREVRRGFDVPLKLSLPIFGLAPYKFKTAFWEQPGSDGCIKANLLSQAADEWLQFLNVNHPDYSFFSSRNSHWK